MICHHFFNLIIEECSNIADIGGYGGVPEHVPLGPEREEGHGVVESGRQLLQLSPEQAHYLQQYKKWSQTLFCALPPCKTAAP